MREQVGAVEDAQLLMMNVVQAIVTVPSAVYIEPIVEEGETTLKLHLSDEDLIWMTGAGGRTVNALRAILEAAGKKHGQSLRLDIVDTRTLSS